MSVLLLLVLLDVALVVAWALAPPRRLLLGSDKRIEPPEGSDDE